MYVFIVWQLTNLFFVITHILNNDLINGSKCIFKRFCFYHDAKDSNRQVLCKIVNDSVSIIFIICFEFSKNRLIDMILLSAHNRNICFS